MASWIAPLIAESWSRSRSQEDRCLSRAWSIAPLVSVVLRDRQRRPETVPETIVKYAETQRPHRRGFISYPNIMVSASLRILRWSLERSLDVSDGLWEIAKVITPDVCFHIACIHTCTHTCTKHVCTHTCMRTHIYMHKDIQTYRHTAHACIHIHTCMHKEIQSCRPTYMCIYIYTFR